MVDVALALLTDLPSRNPSEDAMALQPEHDVL
jgi:hypothetical protein